MSRPITDACPQCDRIVCGSSILMAAQVLPSSPPLSSFLPLPRGSHSFRLLHHAHGQGSAAVVLPLQLSTPLIARPEAWNRMAVSLLGSG